MTLPCCLTRRLLFVDICIQTDFIHVFSKTQFNNSTLNDDLMITYIHNYRINNYVFILTKLLI